MNQGLRCAVLAFSIGLGWIGAAAAADPAPAASAPVPAAAASAASSAAARAANDKRVIEDDRVRIEETRVRGQTQRITVQNKGRDAAPPYEIVPAPPGQDPSQDRGATGKRTWSVLDF